jgi:SWI/SNF-related matrix-associated actin-dependent regulator 1 of chromatin subfamily A
MLRPYQVGVVDDMLRARRWLNYMDMGMGKSLVTLLAVMELEAFPCMIVCSKSAMFVLQLELEKWFNAKALIYVGTPKQRGKIWKEFATTGAPFIITNFSLSHELGQRFGIVKADEKTKAEIIPPPGTKMKLGALVADEIQLGGLFNHKTKTYGTFTQLAKETPVVFLLTGTPYRRGVVDFFGPLSIIESRKFDSYWKYVNTHCVTIDSGFGKGIERNPKNVPAFRQMLRSHSSILKKIDYLHDMPEKVRQAIPVLMDTEQARVYKELTEEMFTLTANGELIMTPSLLTLAVRQRQLLACPQVLGLKTKGAAIETMLEMSEDLVLEKDPFVIFTPFRKAVPYIQEALREKYGGIKIHTITGGLTPEEFGAQWQGFQNGRGARVLICVIKSGASFHATCAATAFFIGYEYDFNKNAQAEDRLYRIGQTRTVNCYYMLHKDTVEDDVIRILNDKQSGADLILSSEERFAQMIKKRR